MKLFIDNNDNVIGIISGSTSDIESNITISDHKIIIVTEEIAKRIEDPLDNLNIRNIKIDNNNIIEKTDEELKLDQDILEKMILDEEKIKRETPIEDMQKQIDHLQTLLDDLTK